MFNALSTSTRAQSTSKSMKTSKTTMLGANPLDSKPAPKRGKEREQPKARKPTKLKRIINKELEDNHKQRQQVMGNNSQLDRAIHSQDLGHTVDAETATLANK
jgi:hypothetical protein